MSNKDVKKQQLQLKIGERKRQLSQHEIDQRLNSVIKSARDTMRKDKGLSGELDRLPMLTWIMFLKFLDDVEKIREDSAKLKGDTFYPTIEEPYRWRDWTGKEKGLTGDDLLAFVNQEEVVRPDGTRGLGLFAYLRNLTGIEGGDRRDVVASVFRGITNRMINGYLLKEVVNLVSQIDFGSSKEIHVLGRFYETMLREMRDAAGDSGEFYTPRPVVRFIVNVINPQLEEMILDPACGTGGFLVESFEHLKKQCKKAEDMAKLQKDTLFGIDAKPLPYLLCQMNLLLHGVESPDIDPGNALRFPLREIGDKDRVDVIMTNPPFGGEEERGILRNFPEDKQTAETALLFLQIIMRRLRRSLGEKSGGRCGMVVPDGTLFASGVGARIKKELIDNFNLHTIVRLPKGVFAPYTGIETNLLFFERDGPTKEIWYYEHPLPPERQKLKNPCYTKSKPLRYEEFEPLIKWWNDRVENEHAWKIAVEDVIKNDYNLDIKNPNKVSAKEYRKPEEIVTSIIEKEKKIFELLVEIRDKISRSDVE
jgi:type I restriction enzyme M protein